MVAVPVETTLHMVHGDGATSYALNSITQGVQQSNLKPMIEEAVASLLNDDNGAPANVYSGGMVITDLGCSSGPNALVLVSTAVDTVRRRCSELRQPPPELCIHLNDLPSNDFNLVIRSLTTYTKTQESLSPVLTSIVPGSFHGRLFNKRSLHLVCSTASLHWLSKANEDLVRNKIPLYDTDETVMRAWRSTVIKAYARQFSDDFTRFLHVRAQEMVPGGRMVFSLFGQRSDDRPENAIRVLEFTIAILHQMASQGLIDKNKLDSFYIPVYGPSEKELREIIEAEGSFSIDKMAIHEPPQNGGIVTPKMRACGMRAVMESIIVQHFGASAEAMDEYSKIAEKLFKMSPLDEYPRKSTAFVAASLTRRT